MKTTVSVAKLAVVAALVAPTAAEARPLECLSTGLVAHARKSPDHTRAVYRRCKPEVRARARRAGITPTTERVRAIFAMGLANSAAPYGQSGAFKYANLIRARRLDCDNYVALAYHVYRQVGGRPAREAEHPHIRFRGWDGGTIGNHAQMWVRDLMVDPTVGVAAKLTVGDALAGRPTRRVLVITRHDVITRHEPEGYAARILGALRRGEYDRSRVLYNYVTFGAFRRGATI